MPGLSNYSSALQPRTDILEKDKQFIIDLELPGIKKDEVNIVLEKGMLSIGGEKKEFDFGEEEISYLKNERYFGKFERKFKLPENIDADSIEAKFEDGILSISINKKIDEKMERTINIA
jgi:HSP20 family protein